MFHRFTLVLLAAIAVAASGCAVTGPSPERRAELSQLSYPAEAPYGETLDIVVVRRGSSIELVNRTPNTYSDLQLWVNRQYVRPVDRIAIGTGNVFGLVNFVNQYQESYPRGGFLQPDKDFPVVLAELYDPDANQRYKLVVQLRPDDVD